MKEFNPRIFLNFLFCTGIFLGLVLLIDLSLVPLPQTEAQSTWETDSIPPLHNKSIIRG